MVRFVLLRANGVLFMDLLVLGGGVVTIRLERCYRQGVNVSPLAAPSEAKKDSSAARDNDWTTHGIF